MHQFGRISGIAETADEDGVAVLDIRNRLGDGCDNLVDHACFTFV